MHTHHPVTSLQTPQGHSPGLFEDQKSEGKNSMFTGVGKLKISLVRGVGMVKTFTCVTNYLCEEGSGGPSCEISIYHLISGCHIIVFIRLCVF